MKDQRLLLDEKKIIYLGILLLIFQPFYFYNISVFTISSIIVFSMFAILLLMNYGKIMICQSAKFYFVFFLWACCSFIWTWNSETTFGRCRDILVVLVLMICITDYCMKDGAVETPEEKCYGLISWFIFCVTSMTIVCFFIEGKNLLSWSRLGLSVYQNCGGQSGFTYILIAALCFSISRVFDKKIYLLLSSFLYLACILTGVRKAAVIPLVFLYIFVIHRNKKYFLKIIRYTILIGVLSLIIVILITKYSSSMASRMEIWFLQLQGESVVDQSLSERAQLRNLAWRCFTEHPILGIGIGTFRYYSFMNGGPFFYAHNNWLEILADLGCVGFILYYINYFRLLLTSNKRQISLAFAFVLTLFISEFAQISYYYDSFGIIFAIMICLINSQTDETLN